MSIEKSNKLEINDVVVINNVFSGTYVEDKIGHEVINFMKADDGKNYIYICPHGDISKQRKNFRDNNVTIINITRATDGKYQIISILTNLSYAPTYIKNGINYCKITYNNKKLVDIFKGQEDKLGRWDYLYYSHYVTNNDSKCFTPNNKYEFNFSDFTNARKSPRTYLTRSKDWKYKQNNGVEKDLKFLIEKDFAESNWNYDFQNHQDFCENLYKSIEEFKNMIK